jgi:hypothetical protein
MSEFDTYVKQLMENAALQMSDNPSTGDATAQKMASTEQQPEAATAPAPEAPAPAAAPVAEVPAEGHSKVAAETNLPEELKQTADALGFMEAYNVVKQANFIKSQIGEASSVNNYTSKQANVNYAAQQPAAQQQYDQAAYEAQLQKSAAEAQAFVDALYWDQYQAHLANEANTWSQHAYNVQATQGQ